MRTLLLAAVCSLVASTPPGRPHALQHDEKQPARTAHHARKLKSTHKGTKVGSQQEVAFRVVSNETLELSSSDGATIARQFPGCGAGGYTWAARPPQRITAPDTCPPVFNTAWNTNDCQWATEFPDGAKIGFLHVGKTGGSTLGQTLKNVIESGSALNISEMHTGAWKPGGGQDEKFDLVVITTRDPVARTISAFNYEVENTDPLAMAAKLQECFPLPNAADAFAKALGPSEQSTCAKVARRCVLERTGYLPDDHNQWATYCGHLNMDHAHYVAYSHGEQPSMLDEIRTGATKAWLVRTESHEEDTRGLLEWLCLPETTAADAIIPRLPNDGTDDRREDIYLTEDNQRTLWQALSHEHQVLEALEQLAENGKDLDTAAEVAKVYG